MSADINPYRSPTVVEWSGDDEAPRLSEGLRRVRTGLLFVYYGIVATLLAFIAVPFVGVMLGMAGLGPTGGMLITAIMSIGFFGGSIAIFVGEVLCVAVPEQSRAKSMAIGAVTAQSLGFLIMFAGLILAMLGLPRQGGGLETVTTWWIQLCAAFAGIVSFFLFVIFLRRLNTYTKNDLLSHSATSVLRLMIATIVGYFAIAGVALLPMLGGGNGVGIPFGLAIMVLLVTFLVTFVKYANLVLYSAKAIARLPDLAAIE